MRCQGQCAAHADLGTFTRRCWGVTEKCFCTCSVYYLLGLWSRLVSSMPYLKGESPSLLETYVPKITEAYLTSRHALSCTLPIHAHILQGLNHPPMVGQENMSPISRWESCE